MKALVVMIVVLFSYSVPMVAQDKKGVPQQKETQKTQEKTQQNKSDVPDQDDVQDYNKELYNDPRKDLGAPSVINPAGKLCKDSLLRDINGMDIPNEGQFPNPSNPNGISDGTLNNDNGELPERMNCNAINDIAPK